MPYSYLCFLNKKNSSNYMIHKHELMLRRTFLLSMLINRRKSFCLGRINSFHLWCKSCNSKRRSHIRCIRDRRLCIVLKIHSNLMDSSRNKCWIKGKDWPHKQYNYLCWLHKKSSWSYMPRINELTVLHMFLLYMPIRLHKNYRLRKTHRFHWSCKHCNSMRTFHIRYIRDHK